MLARAAASHYQAAPEEAEVTLVPTYLVKGGAYARTALGATQRGNR